MARQFRMTCGEARTLIACMESVNPEDIQAFVVIAAVRHHGLVHVHALTDMESRREIYRLMDEGASVISEG